MKNLSLISALFLVLGYTPLLMAGELPIKDGKLNEESCLKNPVFCAKISEAAQISQDTYNPNKDRDNLNEDNWKQKLKEKLGESGSGWNKGYKNRDIQAVTLPKKGVSFVTAKKTVMDKNNKVKTYFLIGIRGTDNIIGDSVDYNSHVRTIKYGDTEIHSGFNNYAHEIIKSKEYKEFFNDIKQKEKEGDFEVLVTGHSLGGAAATIIKANLDSNLPNNKDKISAITFGAPPVGNPAFNEKYKDRVTAMIANQDVVPNLGWNAVRVGEQYQFDNISATEKRQMSEGVRRYLGPIAGLFYDAAKGYQQLNSNPITEGHNNSYFNRNVYDSSAALKGWYEQQNQLMQRSLTTITQGGSSHIGSASYYLGRPPEEDRIDISNAYRVDTFDDGARIQSVPEKEQYTTPAGSITNLKAPVDVVLSWDQSVAKGQIDLDSHLTGPVSLGDSAVRFHTYFNSKGAQDTAPFVFLYRDVIPPSGTGNEQTRIQVLQNGVYRFYVHDYTNKDSTNSTALSNSGANVNVYNGGKNLPTEGQNLGTPLGGAIKVPTNQVGNTWRVFELDSRTGVLKPVNAPLTNVSTPASVPQAGEPNNAPRGGSTTTK